MVVTVVVRTPDVARERARGVGHNCGCGIVASSLGTKRAKGYWDLAPCRGSVYFASTEVARA